MALTRLRPHALKIAAGCELLGAAVLERQVAQLPTFGSAAVLGTKALRGLCDLAVAAGERVAEVPGDPGDLEVPAVAAGPQLDRIPLPRQLLRQRGAVERPDLTCTSEHGPGGDRDDSLVLTHRPRDHDMRMQLRVGRLSARDTPRGRVSVCGRDQILCGLLDDLGAIAAANDRRPLTQIPDRALDRPRVGGLDLLTLPRIPERPDDRHRLRGAERHIDPSTPRAIRTRPAEECSGAGVPALHQRNEIPAVDRSRRVDAQAGERLRGREPAARRLRQLTAGREVVVPTLRRDRLALQIARVAAAPAGTDARSTHHPPGTDPKHPKPATKCHSERTAPAPLCILCGWAVVASVAGPGRGAAAEGGEDRPRSITRAILRASDIER